MAINNVSGNTLLWSGFFPPCRAATTGPITLSGLQTVDGVALNAGDRVLAWQQADATTNGIYAASSSGWVRTTDAHSNTQLFEGMAVCIAKGATYPGAIFQCTCSDDPVVIGTSLLTFATIGSLQLAGLAGAIASQADAVAGTRNDVLMSPLRTAEAIAAAAPTIPAIASQADAVAGTNNTEIMTPLRTAEVLAVNPGYVMATNFAGVVGDGSTLCDTGIANAIAYCVAHNATLAFQDGVYNHLNSLAWAWPGLKVSALGGNVVFQHTGSGIAHNFNGLIHGDPGQGVFRCVFGGPYRFILKGNPAGGTTQLSYVSNWNQGDMKIRGRDAQYIFFGENNTGGQAAAVSSTFDVQISANADGAAFAVTPLVGLYLHNFFGCIFEKPIVEQVGIAASGNAAVILLTSENNLFRGGTVESNADGGINIDTASNQNIFDGLDLEVNGDAYDIYCAGRNNQFRSVQCAATTVGSLIPGNNNKFDTCLLQSLSVSGNENTFDNCNLLVAFSDSGLNNSAINCMGAGAPAVTKIYLGNLSVLGGTGVPAIVAPKGSLYARTDGSSTSTRLYVNTNGSTGWTNLTSAT